MANCSDSLSRAFSENTDEDAEIHLKRFEELKNLCSEKNLETELFKKSIKNVQVANFLRNRVFIKSSYYPISPESRCLKELLKKKEELNQDLGAISKQNRQLEKEVIQKKLHLKDIMKKRKELWNEAVRMHMLTAEKVECIDSSDLFESSDVDVQINEFIDLSKRISVKSNRIVYLSKILHSLILFSGMPLADDKNLLETVLCTGKIIGVCDGIENQKKLSDVVDEAIHRLNFVKI